MELDGVWERLCHSQKLQGDTKNPLCKKEFMSKRFIKSLSTMALIITGSTAMCASTAPDQQVSVTYPLVAGSVNTYEMRAYFDGHFPPFDQPGNPTVHLYCDIIYQSKVLSTDSNGSQMRFSVLSDNILLTPKKMKLGDIPNSSEAIPFPIDLSTVKEALNSSDIVRPDGTIAKVETVNNRLIRVNIGFDLRKLFLLLMPIPFPNTAVGSNSEWNFGSGIIGSDTSMVKYTAKVNSLNLQKHTLKVNMLANSSVNDHLNSTGESTPIPSKQVIHMFGKVKMTGSTLFDTESQGTGIAVSLQKGVFNMHVNLKRIPIGKGVNNSDVQFESGPITVDARMLVLKKNNGATQ